MDPSLHHELVAHANALRRLARDLVHDADLADDVVQDALCTAIARPPRSLAALRTWLQRAVASRASDRLRAERRRRAREAEFAAAAIAGETATAEQVELQRAVLDAVQALAEPYRTAIWHRYYEDRSPREIAAQRGEPVKTVKTRLCRGLQLLRSRLDAERGSRRAWTAALMPFAQTVAEPAGVFAMSAATKLASAAAAVLAIAAAWWAIDRGPDAPPAPARPAGASPLAAAAADAPPPVEPPQRELTEAATSEALRAAVSEQRPEQPGALTFPAAGIVIDIDGRPMPDIELTWNGEPFAPPVVTTDEGTFRVERPSENGLLGIATPGFVAVLAPTLSGSHGSPFVRDDNAQFELTVVVAPAVALGGVVVDDTGRPLPSAQVAVQHGLPLRSRLDRVLDRCIDVEFAAMTLDDGSFALPAVPLVPTAKLHLTARGHRQLVVPVEEARERRQFVLERLVHGDVLEGVVVDEHDAIVPQAIVMMHDHSVVTAPDGSFRFELWRVGDLPAGTPAELEVVTSHHLPAKVASLGGDWRTRGAWPAPLRVRVGGRAESIRGRVVHADGSPFTGAWVRFAPPEPEQIRPTMFEFHELGSSGVARRTARGPDPANGEFETARAAPGRYRLVVLHPYTLEIFVTEPIATGTRDAVIRMPDRGLWPALRGVVVDRRGEPVPDADWMFERDDPTPGAKQRLSGSWQNADFAGGIEHPPVSRDVDTLCVKASGMAQWVRFRLADLPRFDDVRIVVPVGCPARIELAPSWSGVDSAHLLDAGGARSHVVFTEGNRAFGTPRIPITEGRSATFQALDDCTSLVLCRGKDEVARFPIELRPFAINVLRW